MRCSAKAGKNYVTCCPDLHIHGHMRVSGWEVDVELKAAARIGGIFRPYRYHFGLLSMPLANRLTPQSSRFCLSFGLLSFMPKCFFLALH